MRRSRRYPQRVPADSVLYFSAARGHLLLQEEGASLATTVRDADIDFLVAKTVLEIRHGDQVVFERDAEPGLGVFARLEISPECADRAGQPISLPDLVGRAVASASTRDGVLLLVFADGATLRCGPDPDYEAWQVEGGSPLRLIVCRPGGQLSVWDDTPPVPYGELRETAPDMAAALDEMLESFKIPRPEGFPPVKRRHRLWFAGKRNDLA